MTAMNKVNIGLKTINFVKQTNPTVIPLITQMEYAKYPLQNLFFESYVY